MLGKFNVGIMGAGNIAGVMADTLNKMKGVRLYAVASREKVKADVFAGKYGCKKAYGSYEELVTDKKVDLIYIATPIPNILQMPDSVLSMESRYSVKRHLRQMQRRRKN